MEMFRVRLESDWTERKEEDFFLDPMMAKMFFTDTLTSEVNELLSKPMSEKEEESLKKWFEETLFEVCQVEDGKDISLCIEDTDIYLLLEKLWLEE